MSLTGLKASAGGMHSFLQAISESVSLPFPTSRDHLHSWAHSPFLCLQSQQHCSQSFSHSSPWFPLVFLFKDS